MPDRRCPVDLTHIKQSMRGSSHFEIAGRSYHMQTTSQGIELRLPTQSTQRLMLRWPALLRHIRALPAAIKADAKDVDHDQHRPPASFLEWHNYARPERRTAAQELALHLHHQYVREGVARVLTAAFPLAVNDAPSDLLEWLQAGMNST